jgi:hypothetical protein
MLDPALSYRQDSAVSESLSLTLEEVL